jgi:hypothetical protein
MESSALRSDHYVLVEVSKHPFDRRLGGPQSSLDVGAKRIIPVSVRNRNPGFQSIVCSLLSKFFEEVIAILLQETNIVPVLHSWLIPTAIDEATDIP